MKILVEVRDKYKR